ncbi:MAG: hypothetical protein KAI40_04070 [Desulfobacterales bacterium]|nr:hypothetical protein [Desulfobacterales bacterium]
MKRHGNLFSQIICFENIFKAARKTRKGKKLKHSTTLFELELEKNIFKIIECLKNKTYQPGRYRDFHIYDPKLRLISAAPYFDRVIHHAIINIIEPLIGPVFIHDTYACIRFKGTHRAVKRYKQFQKKNPYVLKCDIRKYFPSIDHKILYEKIEKKIKCKDTLWLIKKIIDSREDKNNIFYFSGDDLFTPLQNKKGIPIGNLTSQFFANLYLNDFDHYVKEKLKAKHYIRYCDDFVIFGNSKKELKTIKVEIQNFLDTERLKLHKNKTRVYRTSEGVDFLGYRIFPEYTKVRKSIVKAYRKRLKIMESKYSKGIINLDKIKASLMSWIGHVKHANSYRLRGEMFSKIKFVRKKSVSFKGQS